MEIPLVLIHKTDHPCLEFSLRAAKQFHQNITLITDIKNKYSDYAAIVDIDKMENNASLAFSKVYKHLSTNKYEFEYICIDRWFILLEYMKRNQLNEVIYIDSDVIIYENLSAVIQNYYHQYDICLCIYRQKHEDMRWVASGGHMYTTIKALEQFCEFILNTYTNKTDELMQKWNWQKEHNIKGGINDMTLIYLFQRYSTLKIGNLMAAVNDEFCWDSHLYIAENEYKNEYEMEHSFLINNDVKKIRFINNHPYCYNTVKQKDIRFVLLHFQSDAKRIMPLYMRHKSSLNNWIADRLKILKLVYYAMRREIVKRVKGK